MTLVPGSGLLKRIEAPERYLAFPPEVGGIAKDVEQLLARLAVEARVVWKLLEHDHEARLRTGLVHEVGHAVVERVEVLAEVRREQERFGNAFEHLLFRLRRRQVGIQEVLDGIASAFLFPPHFGKNLDALYDCMTDLVHKAGAQPGFVVVLEQLPDNPRFDREAREQLLDVFRDAADFWGERKIPFRCFYSFQ